MQYIKSWTICSSGALAYTRTAANLPGLVYPSLIPKYRVLIFNGDVDCCVPVRAHASSCGCGA